MIELASAKDNNDCDASKKSAELNELWMIHRTLVLQHCRAKVKESSETRATVGQLTIGKSFSCKNWDTIYFIAQSEISIGPHWGEQRAAVLFCFTIMRINWIDREIFNNFIPILMIGAKSLRRFDRTTLSKLKRTPWNVLIYRSRIWGTGYVCRRRRRRNWHKCV